MKKQHLAYLKRALSLAVCINDGERLAETIGELRCANSPVYQMIRDIVCDSRFYCVVENDDFWKDYSKTEISRFIDSLTADDWENDEQRTGKKEDFLNEWMSRHLFADTQKEKAKITEPDCLRGGSQQGCDDEEEDEDDLFEIVSNLFDDIGTAPAIRDMTESGIRQNRELPRELKDYETEATRNFLQNDPDNAGKGNDAGMESESHQAEADYLKRLDPSIVKLALKIGRRGGGGREQSGKFQSASRSDISGVTTGDDLNSLLPAELAMLGSPATENIFYQRYVQKRLQLFSSASHSSEAGKDTAGPIYICVDTSSSMEGEPEVAAKTLALAIAIVAQRDKRPVCVINYSDGVSFFLLTDLDRQRWKFLSFLSFSYAGGNDENRLFNFIFNQLPQSEKYRRFAGEFSGVDLLVISDFEWMGLTKKNLKLISEARAGGMRFFGLGIGMDNGDLSSFYVSEDDVMLNGYQFLNECDFRYVYNEGKVEEYIEAPNIL